MLGCLSRRNNMAEAVELALTRLAEGVLQRVESGEEKTRPVLDRNGSSVGAWTMNAY